jgi:hypothetical protein
VVGPSVEGGSGESGETAETESIWEKGGLGFFGVALGVHAEFGEEDGAVAGEVVEAGEVALE